MAGSLHHRALIPLLIFGSGVAALSWELLWQHHASLALGVSAKGTAITLATTMAGMAIGSLLAARLLGNRPHARPLRIYAFLEGTIGLCGYLLNPSFNILSRLDVIVYNSSSALAALFYPCGVVTILGLPSLAMGATIPVIGLIARQTDSSVARLYAFNTAGAAAGVLFLAFFLLPHTGVSVTITSVSMINLGIAALSVVLSGVFDHRADPLAPEKRDLSERKLPMGLPSACGMVFLTGCVTFSLEVSWFRSMRAAFYSTTDTFAIILFSVLISLAMGARLAPVLRRTPLPLYGFIFAAGCLILLATPIIERTDVLTSYQHFYWVRTVKWLGYSLAVMGPPFLVLGIALPWLLDLSVTPQRWALFYGVNTAGAVTGSIATAWVLLPTIGFNRAAWLSGFLLMLFALWLMPTSRRYPGAVILILCFAIAFLNDSGVGRERAFGRTFRNTDYSLIESRDGADVTTTVIDSAAGRQLIIDGFSASGELRNAKYMDWMGRLPLLLHPNPETVLVIAMGTGQTAHGARDEEPLQIDIVDVNPTVFDMAHHFNSNHQILADKRVRTITMDGRAWLRRSPLLYDIVTLEPMPPHFAGMNALYSVEFYKIMTGKLKEGAIVAQWLPIHLLTPEHAVAIAAAFHRVFKDAILWLEPQSGTGILLGRYGSSEGTFGAHWPGLKETRERAIRKRKVPRRFQWYWHNILY